MADTDTPTRITPEKNRGGDWVTLGEVQYKIPPLGLRAVREVHEALPKLKGMTGGLPTEEQMEGVATIVHAAMARNYPSLTLDEVADMLDYGNFNEVLSRVMSIAGFKPASAPPAGGAESGEKTAGGTASTSD